MRGRCYGSLDVGLSDQGRLQCTALAAVLGREEPSRVVSSPRRRARETALAIAGALGLEAEDWEELRELDFGELEGRTYDEIASSQPELYDRWMHDPTSVTFPGGEGYAELRARVGVGLARLLSECRGSTVVAVTHGGVVRAVLADVLGIPAERIFRLGIEPASVSEVEWFGDEPVVRVINDTTRRG
jgi:alpha-ribazole phosphatase